MSWIGGKLLKILIAIDSFKGSLSSMEAAKAVKDGILEVVPDAEVLQIPIADGGEGTVNTLVAAKGGRLINVNVAGPLGKP
jgi:glycerate kinase